jgi:hypothetical protein
VARKAGISVAVSLVIGYPNETPERLKQTIDFLIELNDYVYFCEAVLILALNWPTTSKNSANRLTQTGTNITKKPKSLQHAFAT